MNFGNRIQKGYSINLPTYSKIGPSGGSVECKDGDTVVTNTNELEEGKHKVTCIVKNNAGNKATVSKEFNIVETSDYSGESILKILEDNKDMPTGKYTITSNGENYPVHVITYEESQIWKENKVFGDAEDVGASGKYAQNMVIVKVNGDLTIDEGVTVRPYYTAYGGPKGFTLYVTGKLENNGTIDNSHGAKAEGQDVYLWKNADETYEYVPAVGGSGGTNNIGDQSDGRAGTSGTGRQTGGGGGGSKYYYTPGAGTAGTSYSGGSGGGGSDLSGASSAAPNGGAGGNSYGRNYGGGGAGNPGGSGDPAGASGTGGLLILYANEYENNGLISAYGYRGGSSSTGPGGSSGGGSINIFTNQATDINQLGIITDTRYNEILGNKSYVGGSAAGTLYRGGAGGTGTLNIGEIRKGQYYDLKEIIEQDKNSYIESVTIKGDSILSILNDNSLKSGYYFFVANDENYPVHLYTYDRSQIWDENKVFGDAEDIGASGKYAQNMVVVKVEGDLTINKGITVRPYYTAYGGPKGFTLYVTGKLENNGTIDNSHGAYAKGQNVYLWKNVDETYEYVPAVGGSGGTNNIGDQSDGRAGTSGTGRQTGGGGGGSKYYYTPGAGTAGTSYSGGSGGGGSDLSGASSAAPNGGAGGNSYGRNYGGGGAGNPGGSGDPAGASGTGGLLILYANEYENNGLISAYGYRGGSSSTGPGGSSGGGSINIFYLYQKVKGNTNALGGSAAGTLYYGGAGGTGTVTYTQLQPVSFALKYTYPDLTKDTFAKESSIVTINYSSTLTKKLYSLDDGNTWLNYKKPFEANQNDKILAKGVNEDDSETEVITYIVPETDGIPYNAFDGTTSEAATLEANKDYVFTVSNEVEGRNLRFFLGSEASVDASIKVYDKTNKEVLSTTFVDKLTVINIPEGSYKFVINGGSKELTINEINLREEKEIVNEIPIIETNDTAWSVDKIIDITYPEGYENEYSLDLGETWIKYEEPITIEKETIIFARTKKDGKVVTTNSYMINKVDAEEPTIELELENEYEYDYNTDVSIPTKYTVGKSLGTPICKTNDKEITNIKDLEKGTYEITCSITNGAKVTKEVSKEITINEYDPTNFDYTGDEQTYNVEKTGLYRLEVWGANPSYGGGYGGYSIGRLSLTEGDELSVVVGGAPTTSRCGYNGGGLGNEDSNVENTYVSGGGGATHIALNGEGELYNYENSKEKVLIVAGGGGGGTKNNNANSAGGSGGGYKGNPGEGTYHGNGGTQTAGGIKANEGATDNHASFGKGSNADPLYAANQERWYAGGGGGGWYGGSGGSWSIVVARAGGGGGGSGYIGNALLKTKAMYCYNCEESDEESTKTISTTCVNETPTKNCAKIGNGYARITYIGE